MIRADIPEANYGANVQVRHTTHGSRQAGRPPSIPGRLPASAHDGGASYLSDAAGGLCPAVGWVVQVKIPMPRSAVSVTTELSPQAVGQVRGDGEKERERETGGRGLEGGREHALG